MQIELNCKPQEENGIKRALLQKNACYVLITCSEPSEDGKMEIEMTYEGDAVLAAYLLESAQGQFDHHHEF